MKWKEGNKSNKGWASSVELNYQGTPYIPNMRQLLPLRDTNDPLNIFMGNPLLKNSFEHSLMFSYMTTERKIKHSLNLNARWHKSLNNIVMLSDYNSETGIRNYTPQNSNSNYWTNVDLGYTLPIGKGKHVWLRTNLSADYFEGEVMARINGAKSKNSGLLQNLKLRPSLSLNTHVGDFKLFLYWHTDFQTIKQRSSEDKYRTTRLSCSLRYNLPWPLELHSWTYLNIYEGYRGLSGDKTDSRWDLSLNKSFKLSKGRLYIGLKGYDILGQSKSLNTQITNAFRSETYSNVLPRHLLLSISYHINWTPKRKGISK